MTTHDEHADDYGEERSPWSKPSVLLSGMFVLALLVAGIAFLILKGGSSTPHHAHATTPGSGPPPATVNTPARTRNLPTACTLPAGDQTVPYNSPPLGTQWGQVGSMNVPEAPGTLGPQRTSGVWNTCFAPSPSGALLAAMNFWAEGTTNPPRAVLPRLALDVRGPIQDNTTLDQDFQGPPQVAGYEYRSYSPVAAHIVIALRAPNGNYESLASVMRWTGSDWRFAAPAAGAESYETFADLPADYVQWSGF